MSDELETMLIGIGSGMFGGLVVTLINHYLTKDRDRVRKCSELEDDAKYARLQFIAFLHRWRKEFDRLYLEVGGYTRDGNAFLNSVPEFIEAAAMICAELPETDRGAFQSLVSAIANRDGHHIQDQKRYKDLLAEVDALVAFLETRAI